MRGSKIPEEDDRVLLGERDTEIKFATFLELYVAQPLRLLETFGSFLFKKVR